MGRYYDIVKTNYNKLRNDDKVMWASIEMWDKHLEEMREHHPDKYWEIMRDTHELMYGEHFDESYAVWQVQQMSHVGNDGKTYKGEHWSIEDTTNVMSAMRGRIPAEYNEYDVYVALNAHYHDTVNVAMKHFDSQEKTESYIIDEALAFWFNDSDWPGHNKPWAYFRNIPWKIQK